MKWICVGCDNYDKSTRLNRGDWFCEDCMPEDEE